MRDHATTTTSSAAPTPSPDAATSSVSPRARIASRGVQLRKDDAGYAGVGSVAREQATNLGATDKVTTEHDDPAAVKTARARDNLVAELGARAENFAASNAELRRELDADAKEPNPAKQMPAWRCAVIEDQIRDNESQRVAADQAKLDLAARQDITLPEIEAAAKRAGVSVDDTQDETKRTKGATHTKGSSMSLSSKGAAYSTGEVERDADGKVTKGRQVDYSLGAGKGEMSAARTVEGAGSKVKTSVSAGQDGVGFERMRIGSSDGDKSGFGVSGSATGVGVTVLGGDAKSDLRTTITAKQDELGVGRRRALLGADGETEVGDVDYGISTNGAHAKGSYDLVGNGMMEALNKNLGALRLPGLSSFKVGGGLSVKVKTTPHPLAATDPAYRDKVLFTAVVTIEAGGSVGSGKVDAANRASAGHTEARARTVSRVFTPAEAQRELGRLADAQAAQLTTYAEWQLALPMLFSDAGGDKVGDANEVATTVTDTQGGKLGPVSGSRSTTQKRIVRRVRVSDKAVRITVAFVDASVFEGAGAAEVGDEVKIGEATTAKVGAAASVGMSEAEARGESVSVDVDANDAGWRGRADRIEAELAGTKSIAAARAVADKYGVSGWSDMESQTSTQGANATGEASVDVALPWRGEDAPKHKLAVGAGMAAGTTTHNASEIALTDGQISSANEGSSAFDVNATVMGGAVLKAGTKAGGTTASKGTAGQIDLSRERSGQRFAPGSKGWADVDGIGQTVANLLTEETKSISTHSFGPDDVDVLISRAKNNAIWTGAGEVLGPKDFNGWMTLGEQLRSPWSLDDKDLRARLAKAPPADKKRLLAELAMALRMRGVARWLSRGEVALRRIVAVMERPGETYGSRAHSHEQRGTRRDWPEALAVPGADFAKLEGDIPAFVQSVATDPSYQNPFKRASAGEPLLRRLDAIAKALDGAKGVDGASLGDMRADLATLRQTLQGALGAKSEAPNPQRAIYDDALQRCEAFKRQETDLKVRVKDTWFSNRKGTVLMTDVATFYEQWIPWIVRARKAGTELGLKAMPISKKGAGMHADPRHEPDKHWFKAAWDEHVRDPDNPVLARLLSY